MTTTPYDTDGLDPDSMAVSSPPEPVSEEPAPVRLTRQAILMQTFVPKYEDIDCPEWGGVIRIREMSGEERDRWEFQLLEGKGRNRQANLLNFRARLIAATAVDENGKLMFSKSDIELLGKQSSKVLTRLVNAAQELSGLTDDDVDELTAPLGNAPSDDSGSS